MSLGSHHKTAVTMPKIPNVPSSYPFDRYASHCEFRFLSQGTNPTPIESTKYELQRGVLDPLAHSKQPHRSNNLPVTILKILLRNHIKLRYKFLSTQRQQDCLRIVPCKYHVGRSIITEEALNW